MKFSGIQYTYYWILFQNELLSIYQLIADFVIYNASCMSV